MRTAAPPAGRAARLAPASVSRAPASEPCAAGAAHIVPSLCSPIAGQRGSGGADNERARIAPGTTAGGVPCALEHALLTGCPAAGLHTLRMPAGTADIVPVPPELTTPPAVVSTLKAFKRLQNGSDIRGVAIESEQPPSPASPAPACPRPWWLLPPPHRSQAAAPACRPPVGPARESRPSLPPPHPPHPHLPQPRPGRRLA
jgi:hypothetical protein